MRTARFRKSAPNSTSSIKGLMQAGPTIRNINSSIISSWSLGCRYSNAQPETSGNASTEIVMVLYAPKIGVTRFR